MALVCPVNAPTDCSPSLPVAPTNTLPFVVIDAPTPPAELADPSSSLLSENGTSAR